METVKKTRSGRVIKQPVRYEPVEKVEDDFSDSEIESHWDSDISSEVSYDPEDVADEESSDDDSFIVPDSESESEENDEIKNESDDVEDDGSDDDSAESVGSS